MLATASTYARLHKSRRSIDESNALIQAEMKKYSDPVVVGTSGCKLAECALAYGLVYSRGLDREVSHVLTNFIYYDLWNKKLSVFGVGSVGLAFASISGLSLNSLRNFPRYAHGRESKRTSRPLDVYSVTKSKSTEPTPKTLRFLFQWS